MFRAFLQETSISVSNETVLVVEDDADIRDVIQYNLEREGYEVLACEDGESAWRTVRENRPDLVLLDLMLPGKDGVEICREMRADEATEAIPVIMVTARDTESDVVLGLGVGADDYLTKPFSPRELLARVRAVLRRSRRTEKDEEGRLRRGVLVIDPERHEVRVEDEPVDLTATEFQLLHYLASHPGRVFSRDQLIRQAMGNVVVSKRNVDVHVRSIREKLEEHRDLIETVRGVGYRFQDTKDG